VVVIVILALHIPQDRKWGLARDALSCCLAVEDKCPAGMVLSCRTDARSSLYRAISCSCPHTKKIIKERTLTAISSRITRRNHESRVMPRSVRSMF
jgi:hypothetical protein